MVGLALRTHILYEPSLLAMAMACATQVLRVYISVAAVKAAIGSPLKAGYLVPGRVGTSK